MKRDEGLFLIPLQYINDGLFYVSNYSGGYGLNHQFNRHYFFMTGKRPKREVEMLESESFFFPSLVNKELDFCCHPIPILRQQSNPILNQQLSQNFKLMGIGVFNHLTYILQMPHGFFLLTKSCVFCWQGFDDIIPKNTLLWKLKLLKSAAAYTNSRLHAVKAEVLILSRFLLSLDFV